MATAGLRFLPVNNEIVMALFHEIANIDSENIKASCNEAMRWRATSNGANSIRALPAMAALLHLLEDGSLFARGT